MDSKKQTVIENPITGVERLEALRFHVMSRSQPLPWLVDLREFNFNGQCNCPNFAKRKVTAARQWAMGLGDEPGTNTQCWHIKRAKEWLYYELVHQLADALQDRETDRKEW